MTIKAGLLLLFLFFGFTKSSFATTFREVSEPDLYQKSHAVCVARVLEITPYTKMNMVWSKARLEVMTEAGGCLKGNVTNSFTLGWPGGRLTERSSARERTTVIPGGVQLKPNETAIFFLEKQSEGVYTLSGWKHLSVSPVQMKETGKTRWVLNRSLRSQKLRPNARVSASTAIEDIASFKRQMESRSSPQRAPNTSSARPTAP